MTWPAPSAANDWLAAHTERLRHSFRRWTGRDLVDPALEPVAAARWLYQAPFALVSHDDQADPRFNYANLTAQRLFERSWEVFVGLPSRLSAEAPLREERQRLLDQVARHGYIDDYRGVRISRSGRRFRIERATVWNVTAADGRLIGQAACFSRWHWLYAPG